MFQVSVFGRGYYVDPKAVPKAVYHKLKFLTGKFGENLDLRTPAWARHKANMLARKFIPASF